MKAGREKQEYKLINGKNRYHSEIISFDFDSSHH